MIIILVNFNIFFHIFSQYMNRKTKRKKHKHIGGHNHLQFLATAIMTKQLDGWSVTEALSKPPSGWSTTSLSKPTEISKAEIATALIPSIIGLGLIGYTAKKRMSKHRRLHRLNQNVASLKRQIALPKR